MTRSWLMHSANISSKSWYIFLQYNLSHCDPMQVKLSTYDRHFCWYRSISLHSRAVSTNSSATVIPSGANTLNSKWLSPAITAVTISKSSLKTHGIPLTWPFFGLLPETSNSHGNEDLSNSWTKWANASSGQQQVYSSRTRNVLPAPELKDFSYWLYPTVYLMWNKISPHKKNKNEKFVKLVARIR